MRKFIVLPSHHIVEQPLLSMNNLPPPTMDGLLPPSKPPVHPSFYSFLEILTPLPFVSHNSSVVSREAAIISGLVGESKDQVQMELDA